MITVTQEIEVALSAAEVWTRLGDLSAADKYVQGLTAVAFTTSLHRGVGASRRVTQGKSLRLDETVVRWDEGQGFSLRLHRGDRGPLPPFAEHFFDYGVRERAGKVWLVNSMRYSVRMGWLGRVLDALVLRRVITGALRDVTLAQKLYYESGEQVTPALLQAAKAERGD